MHRRLRCSVLLALSLPGLASLADDAAEPAKQRSVIDLMLMTITPASNTLWSIDDPQTDADWKPFEDAALALIDAGSQIRDGGTGPLDAEWAADPRWIDWTDIMIGAAEDALEAARERELDAFVEATNVMYPPCEECHIQFNPRVQ